MKPTVLLTLTAFVVSMGSALPASTTPLDATVHIAALPLAASAPNAALELLHGSAHDDDDERLARRRKARKRGKKPPPEPEAPPPPPPPPPPPEPKGPRVLVFPPVVDGGDAALAASVRAAVIAEVKTLHGAGKLHFEGGVEKVAALEIALGSLLASCQAQTTCLIEQGQAAKAAFVLAMRVTSAAEGNTIDVSLVEVGQASLDVSHARRLPAERDVAQEVSATARLALRRFLDAGEGTVNVIVTEPGATVRVDGAVRGMSPIAPMQVGSGPHLVQVSKEGWFDFDTVAEVPRGGGQDVEVVLEPTPALLEAKAFGQTLWAALAWSTVGVGALTALAGGGLVGWNALRAGELSQEITAANEQYAATGVPDDVAVGLQAQKDEVNLLTGVGGGIIGVGALVAGVGVVLLFLGE